MQDKQPSTCSKACSSPAAGALPPTDSAQHATNQQTSKCSTSDADSTQAASANKSAASSSCSVKLPAGSKSVMAAGAGLAAAASAAFVSAKLGLGDQLDSALVKTPGLACLRDADGRCCLHYAAGYGHEDCVDLLLDKGGSEVVRLRDNRGDLALHMAAQQGHPMCTYNLAKVCTASCMAKNKAGHSPIDVAAAAGRGEVLNAMLLACSGDGNSAVAVAAMRLLLAAGAVPDTWAPNGSSALMLAASANGVAALQVLLEGGATIELQDALGRSALMFAAGSDATAACNVLLEAHASLSARDRRGRAALDYAPAGSESAKLLQKKLDELESVACQLQQQLLQEGTEAAAKPKAKAPAAPAAAAVAAATPAGAVAEASTDASGTAAASSSASKKKKKKKGAKAAAGSSPGVAPAAASAPAQADATKSGSSGSKGAASAPAPSAAEAKGAAPAASAGAAFGPRSFADAVGPAVPEEVSAATASLRTGSKPEAASEAAAGSSTASGQQQGESFPTAAAAVQEEEWQVVAPKSKSRAGPSGSQPCPSGSNTPRGSRGHGAAGSSGGGLHQQVLLSAAGMAAGSNASKHTAAAGRHRRQGSAHSICSTMSFASCDSSSCSAVSSNVGGISSASVLGLAHRSGTGVASPRRAWGARQQPQAEAPTNSGKDTAAERAPQQRGASAGEASAQAPAAAACSTPRGFKAALLKAGQDGTASNAATPTVGATLAAPGAAFAAALQAVKADAAAAQPSQDATADAGSSNSSSNSRGTLPAAVPTKEAVPAAAPAGDSAVEDSHISTEPTQAQQGAVSCTEASEDTEQQQQLQRMAGELLQARADLAAAQLQLHQQVSAHQQQLATILEDAAAHEAAAVQAAVEAAVVETLQSPMLLQVLSTGVQQAVLKERTSMQVKLVNFGLPPAAVLHILTQPLQQPPPPATPRGADASAAAAAGTQEECTGDAEGCGTAGANSAGHAADALASAAAAVPNGAPLMAQMLSALTSNVLAASGAGGGASATQQQQQHMQQMLFLQRLRQQQQAASQGTAVPELNLDIRSEYYGGASAFVAPAKQQQDRGGAAATRESAAEAILKLHTDRSSCDSQDDVHDSSARVGGQRRSSSGCSTMSALDDAPVTDVAAAVGSFYGTIGCNGGGNSSCSPHSSSGCSSAFGPIGNVNSPAGGSLWGEASLVGSPALGTSPFLGPSALPLHTGNFSSSYPSIPRTSPLGFASGCSAASAAAHTQWGFQQPQQQQQQGTFAAGFRAKQGTVGAAGDGRSSMDSSRLVDLLPDEL